MITPVPAGVNPNTHKCGCGSQLKMPWVHEIQDHALVCRDDLAHDTYQKKYTGTKMLSGPNGTQVEVYVATGKETSELAPITDESSALAAVQRASAMELFPTKTSTPDQLALLAHVALLYRLDPNMGEIIPYQGKPYITIKGRRRMDNVAGNRIGIAFRPLRADEKQDYLDSGAMNLKDVVQVCVGTYPDGLTVEGTGRVLSTEGMTNGRLSDHLPVAVRKIEMAQVRAERRMREMAFGPIARPEGLDSALDVLQEGDEANVVESTGRIVPDDPVKDPFPELGTCPEHGTEWKSEERFGRVTASHHIEGKDWCKFGDVYGTRLRGAWEARHGEFVKPEVDAWLKELFDQKTWSKMEPVEMLEAMSLLTTLPDRPETDTEAPVTADPTESPPDANKGLETAHVHNEGKISTGQINSLIDLCGDDVPLADLLARVKAMTGEDHLGNIRIEDYEAIQGWVNREVDIKMAAAENN